MEVQQSIEERNRDLGFNIEERDWRRITVVVVGGGCAVVDCGGERESVRSERERVRWQERK